MPNSTKPLDMVLFGQQVTAFEDIRPVYEAFARVLHAILEEAVKSLGVSASVQVRAKEISSFAEKMVRKQSNYPDAINQMCDLCGARVIVSYKDEIEPVCAYIRETFEIDEANTEDVFQRLGTGEFGYLSVHFAVSLKQGEFDDILTNLASRPDTENVRSHFDRLFERRTADECQIGPLQPGPRFKAEIQVRTLLQHAWAEFAHDRLYKSGFDIPRHLMRDANRIAATLENADAEFARTVNGVQTFHSFFGPYKGMQERVADKEKLLAVLAFDPQNLRLAHDAARMAISVEDWATVAKVTKPLIEQWESTPEANRIKRRAVALLAPEANISTDGTLRRSRRMAEILMDYGLSLMREKPEEGRMYLEWAVAADDENVDAWICLAETYLPDDPDLAMPAYENAFLAASDEPRALSGYLLCKIMVERNLDFISPLVPSLEQGIGVCRERARAGVYLPQAFFDMGLFHLLCGRPYDSLFAYTKAVCMCPTVSMIEDHHRIINRLTGMLKGRVLEKKASHFEWVSRCLTLAMASKLLQQTDPDDPHNNAPSENYKTATFIERELSPRKVLDKNDLTHPIVIIAGGCGPDIEVRMQEYCGLVAGALDGYQGVILSGGTQSGICGLVGDWAEQRGQKGQLFSYLPRSIPATVKVHPAYRVYHTHGSDFSAYEILQCWNDLIAAGIRPKDVKLLGINGGRIAAFEYRLALALGAQVGVIRDSGRAASALADDPNWDQAKGLLRLPADVQTVRSFLKTSEPSEIISADDREAMARSFHAAYVSNRKKQITTEDPALNEWEALPEDLKNSNRSLVDDIDRKLNALGYRLRRSETVPAPMSDFSEDDIDRMSEMEHGRWNSERLAAGWGPGERDAANRKSPYLVSWAELPKDIKVYDREAVLEGLKLLSQHGYEVYRKAQSNDN